MKKKLFKKHSSPSQPKSFENTLKKSFWMYGLHPILAALKNPDRRKDHLLLAPSKKEDFLSLCDHKNIIFPTSLIIEEKDPSFFNNLFPPQTVHQGIALLVHPLPSLSLEDILERASPSLTLVLLDCVTDPHNVGAILRSVAAFGADALVLLDHHGAALTAVTAKSASGALDTVPIIEVKNMAQTLETLKKHNIWCYGLDEQGTDILGKIDVSPKCAFVLGSEGEGLRRLTKEKCDVLIQIPTHPQFPTLNVSTSTAICLYERVRSLTL